MQERFALPEMPFYWRTKNAPNDIDPELPGRLPFVYAYDGALGLLIEERSPALGSLLERMYRREANVGFLQEGNNLAKGYGEDFWTFLAGVLQRHRVANILEIGCGGCLLLERLKASGYRVAGIDPSPVAVAAGHARGIEVLQDFFPSPRLKMAPDLIFHVDVLEHAQDPVGFLRQQREALRTGALLVVNVPDATQSIELGDISMTLHQHVNMFSVNSLSRTLRAAGFEVLEIARSGFGKSLYALAANPSPTISLSEATAPPRGEFARFVALAERNIEAFQRAFGAAQEAAESIGFFMPMRAFPYLATLGIWQGYRLFDNQTPWHGRYFDGIDVPVENQADLFSRPVDHVFVMSLSFGDEVRAAIAKGAPTTVVTTLAEILAGAGSAGRTNGS